MAREGRPENLKPIRSGEVRNPTGRNQYTARREFEAAIDDLLRKKTRGGKTRAQAIAEMALAMAQQGDGRLLAEVLKRLWPATERREVSGPEGAPIPVAPVNIELAPEGWDLVRRLAQVLTKRGLLLSQEDGHGGTNPPDSHE